MNPQQALEILVMVANRAPINEAEKIGVQASIRVIENSFAQHAALQKKVQEMKTPPVKSEPPAATQDETPSGDQNIQINATEKAEIPVIDSNPNAST